MKVVVDGDRTPVISELETRIIATTRYPLTPRGYTCDSGAIHFPSGRYAVFPQPVNGYIAGCSVDAPSDSAESLFDDFVKSTQRDKLKMYDKAAYSEYIRAYEQGYIAGMAIESDLCKAENAQKKPQKAKKP